jgi:hypothetical protein
MMEPEVVVPAFLSDYHEVMRNDLAWVLTPLALGGHLAEFAEAWGDYQAAVIVHTAMKDGLEGSGNGVALLNHCFDGAAACLTFDQEHRRQYAAQESVSKALGLGQADLRHAFNAYRRVAEEHLAHEDAVILPLVQRLTSSSAALFSHWCISAGVANGGFEHFVAHGVASFAIHGSRENSPAKATRIFLHSLQAVCSPALWAVAQPTARAAAFGPIWHEVIAEVPSLGFTAPA